MPNVSAPTTSRLPVPTAYVPSVSGQAQQTPRYVLPSGLVVLPTMRTQPASGQPLAPSGGRVVASTTRLPAPTRIPLLPSSGLPAGSVQRPLSFVAGSGQIPIPGQVPSIDQAVADAQIAAAKLQCQSQGGTWGTDPDTKQEKCLSPAEVAAQSSWWGRQSTGVKAAIIGGAVVAGLGIGYFVFVGAGKKKAASPNARRGARRNGYEIIAGFGVGERVQLHHPGTDRWMRGDKYGEIVSIVRGGKKVRVKLDRSGQTVTLSVDRVTPID
jgi:hypothetical protein